MSDSGKEQNPSTMTTPAALTSENIQALQDNDLFEYNSDLETLTSISSNDSSSLDDTAQRQQAGDLKRDNQADDRSSTNKSPNSQSSPLESTATRKLNKNANKQSKEGSDIHEGIDTPNGEDDVSSTKNSVHNGVASDGESEADSEDESVLEARRMEAFKELTQIEIDFAHLRERLFCERVTQLDRERYLLFNSQHPEYQNQISEITKSHNERVGKLKLWHSLRVEQRKKLYLQKIEGIKYNYNVKRQELRRNLLDEQMSMLHKLKDAHRRLEREKNGPQKPVIHPSSRFYSKYISRNLQRPRKQQLKSILPKLLPSEQNDDFRAMDIPVIPQEKPPQRKIYVPPCIPEAAEKKRQKPRQYNRNAGSSSSGAKSIQREASTAASYQGPDSVKASRKSAANKSYSTPAMTFPTQSYPLDSVSSNIVYNPQM